MNRRLLWVLGGFAVTVISATAGLLHWHLVHTRELAISELLGVAQQKRDLAQRWFDERSRNAHWIFAGSGVPRRAEAWFEQPGDPALRNDLIRWMEAWRADWLYARVVLFDPAKQIRMYSADSSGQLSADEMGAIDSSLRDHRVVPVDLHLQAPGGKAAFGFVVPLLVRNGEHAALSGAVYLESDPHNYLFPQLQSWPRPNTTGEVLLLREEGDRALVLNTLRHRSEPWLRMQLPQPAMFDGVVPDSRVCEFDDYRGERVLAAALRVPRTSWMVIAKQDLLEIDEPVRRAGWLAAAFVVGSVSAGALAISWIHRSREFRSLRQELAERAQLEICLRESARRLEEAQQIARLGSFRYELPSGHWTNSPLLDEIVGFTQPAPVRSAAAWTNLVHPDDRARVRAHFHREVLGSRLPLDCECRVIRPDGAIRWIHALGQVFFSDRDEPLYLVGTVKDITAAKAAEQALRESQQRLALHIEQTPLGVIEWDLTCHVTAWNPAAQQIFGYTAAEALGRHAADLIVAEHQKVHLPSFWRSLIDGNGGRRTTNQNVTKNGRTVFCKWFNTPLIDASGRVTAIASLVLDVSEHKRDAEALEQSTAELAAIHERAPTIMLLVDDQRRVRRLNRAALVFAGRPDSASVIGMCCGQALGCIHAQGGIDGCGSAAECRECALRRTTSLEVLDETTRLETSMRFVRGGEIVDLVLLVSAADLEINGTKMALLCIEDITRQKRAEEHVREQAALLNVTKDAIFVVDLDGLVTFWNRGAEMLYGWSVAEAVGTRLSQVAPEVGSATSRATISEAVWNKGEWAGEVRRANRAGQVRIVQSRATLVHDAFGEPRSILVVNTDLTEAKKLESQFLRAQRLDSLGKLASGVAHDLNNVLAPIMMSLELLRPLATRHSDRELFRLLGESVKRGGDVVRQLLLFGRGNEEPRFPVDPGKVLKEVADLMRQTFPKSIAITTEIAAPRALVLADATQLHQVFLNLCVNARDAMPAGGILDLSLAVADIDAPFAATQPGAKPGRYVVMTVADTGSGISPDIVDKVFDPFFTTKPIGAGTGLGLSTVLGIVRSHDGFVMLETQLGAGTRFSVYLPATADATSDRIAPSPGSFTGRGELLLVIDDEPAFREALRRTLEMAHYRVVLATDAAEGVAVWSRQRQHLHGIVTDLAMPGTDGIQMVRTLRQAGADLPVIVLSGAPGVDKQTPASELGAIELIAKPLTAAILLAALRRTLGAASLVPANAEGPTPI